MLTSGLRTTHASQYPNEFFRLQLRQGKYRFNSHIENSFDFVSY